MTIKPGYLVSVKTSRQGGVKYLHSNQDKRFDGKKREISKWETTRLIDDVVEFDRAANEQLGANYLIAKCCIRTPFGYVCPEEDIIKLDEAIKEAHLKINAFNATAQHTTLYVRVLKGKIAANDSEAFKAITGEIRELATKISAGITTADIKQIREAASMAKSMGRMLDTKLQSDVNDVVKAARAAARLVTKLEKKGEKIEAVMLEEFKSPIDKLSKAFLDLDVDETSDDCMPSIDVNRAVDLDIDN